MEVKSILIALSLLSPAIVAGESWQLIDAKYAHGDMWHIDTGSIQRLKDTAIVRLRLSLFSDTTVNSTTYVEEFMCDQPRSKTLSVQFTLNGTTTEMDRLAPDFEPYFIPSVWQYAQKVACRLPHP